MIGHHRRHPRRAFDLHHVAFLVVVSILLLAPALDGLAQGIPIRQQPTATTEPESPQGNDQVATEPTVTPTPRVTEEPAIDDLQGNPTAVPTEEPPPPAPPSSLTINKGACDDSNFDPATASGLDAFLDACQGVDGEFEFTVSNGGDFSVTGVTELGTFFTQVPTGPITITETIPGGWGDPAVFCWSNLSPVPSDTPYVGNGPTWDVQPGEDIECWWFNVSLGSPTASLTIHAWSCPPFYDPLGAGDPIAECTVPMDGVTFDLGSVDPAFADLQAVTSATVPGAAVFTGVEPGFWAIQEQLPAGYELPFLWSCTDLSGTPLTTVNYYELELIAGQAMDCHWFNVENNDNHTINVVKWLCPDGIDPASDVETLQDECTTPVPGVGFALVTDGGTQSDVTGASGRIQWTDVDLGGGQIQIDEEIPDGFGEPVVFCGDLPADAEHSLDFQSFPYASTDGLVTATPAQAEPFVFGCAFYNFEESGTGGNLVDPASLEGNEGVTVVVGTQVCPENVPADTGFNDLRVACGKSMEGVTFTLQHDGGSLPTGTGEDGFARWRDAPFGAVTITETIPAGFGDPIVSCSFFNNYIDLWQGVVPSENGIISLDIPEDATNVLCTFINIPDPEGAEVTVVKHRCPLGVPEDTTIDQYIVICTEAFGSIPFTLDHEGGSFPGETGDDGQVEWPGVPAGEIEIHETIPEGFKDPLAFCTTFDGEQELESGQVTATGGVVPLAIPADATAAVCYLFNIPDIGGETRVLVNKRVCPGAADLVLTDDNSINDIITACPTEGNGIEFTLDSALGSSTQAIGDGATWWDGVPNGPITITETIPPGYLEPVWYCDSNPFDAAGELPGQLDWMPVIAPGGVLDVSLDEPYGEVFACWVFNVPDPDSSTVTVHKWLCPAGFDVETDDPVADCTEPMDNVNFTLDDLVATTGDDGPGIAVFENVPPGAGYELTEFLPGDTAYAFVTYCTLNGGPAVIPLTEEAPPVVTLDIDPGDHWVCHWYNVPNGENDIQIHKWLCPEGFDPNSTDQEYFEICTEALDGITFKAMSDLGIAVLDTVGGQVGFGGFPAGMNVGIQEEIPDGYGNPYVICEYDDDAWHDVGATSGFFEVYFDGSGETVECHVFNLHGEDPDLTILKWTCPVGYDLLAAGADPLADCTEATNGIAFELRFEGDATLQQTQTTGDVIDGGVIFDDLEPDIYNVAELVPDGIASAFILECTGHIMGVLQPYPLQFGPVLDDIDLDAGEHLTCHWFNVPGGEGGDLTLVKYTCTTEEFVSEVDCEIFEDGKPFDLLHWNTVSGEWEVDDTQVTDGFGRISWIGLDPGDYSLDEHDGDWCHLTTNPVFGPGDGFSVTDGEETVVKVYNCDGEPGKPGDTPTKYPNTGVPPGDSRRDEP